MLKMLDLARLDDDGVATLGMMRLVGEYGETFTPWQDQPYVHTIERPWLNNQPSVSCIPVGQYLCKLGRYNRGGYTAYEVLDVPGRTYIKIHIANWAHQLAGCIAPGRRSGMLGDLPAVMASRLAFNLLMTWASGDEFMILRIRNV